MVTGIDAAARGMMAQQINMDVLANNLANINTTGFKQLLPVFRSVDQAKPEEGFGSENEDENQEKTKIKRPFGIISAGCAVDATVVDFNQGSLRKTENSLDFAINGEGFFAVETEEGECYTRNGSFTLNEDGNLVTKDGKLILDESGGSITLNLQESSINELKIRDDGTLVLGKQILEKLKVVKFEKPEGLISIGDSLFKPVNENIEPIEAKKYKIEQGFVENSNSNTVETMIKTITATRTYETLAKVLKSAEGTMSKAVNEVGRVVG